MKREKTLNKEKSNYTGIFYFLSDFQEFIAFMVEINWLDYSFLVIMQ